jgi:hypothetical protein
MTNSKRVVDGLNNNDSHLFLKVDNNNLTDR